MYFQWCVCASECVSVCIIKQTNSLSLSLSSYNYSGSQPQKIYRSAPSENTLSKAYV